MTKAKKKDLKASVEEQISAMLDSTEEPSDGRLKLLALGIKMCALNAKLQESEYGDFFTDDAETGLAGEVLPKKPRQDKRKGSAAPPDES